MIGATFILHDERVIEATGEAGDSLMEVATRHDVPGISGDCGGCVSCGTCHAYVDTAFAERLPPPRCQRNGHAQQRTRPNGR